MLTRSKMSFRLFKWIPLFAPLTSFLYTHEERKQGGQKLHGRNRTFTVKIVLISEYSILALANNLPRIANKIKVNKFRH